MFKGWEEMGTKASVETPKLNARADGGVSELGDKAAEPSEQQDESNNKTTTSEQHLRFPQHYHKT